MRSTNLPYEYSTEPPCDKPGEYLARLYTAEKRINNAERTRTLSATQHKIGESLVDAMATATILAILEEADAQAAEVAPDPTGQRKPPYPLGCTILKACAKHGGLEIIQHALVVPPDWDTFKVLATSDIDTLVEDESGTAPFPSRVEGYPNMPGAEPVRDDEDIVTLHVLPHVTDPKCPTYPQGIRLNRGGRTFPVDFLLLGDERLVTEPPQLAS